MRNTNRKIRAMKSLSISAWRALIATICLVLLASAPAVLAAPPSAQPSFANYPLDPTADIPWSDSGLSGVAAIQAAFNNGRTQENAQLGTAIPVLTMPSQAEWDAKSDSERAFWLINRDRIDRGVMALDNVETNVTSVAQTYAQYLLDNNAWGHNEDGRSPWQRMDANPTIGACREFLSIGENLAVFVTSGSSIALPVERSVYMWNYDDSGSSWGHRHANMWYPYNDNSGTAGKEGFFGIGRAHGGPYQGPFSQPWNYAEIIVMNVFDPCSSWSYPSQSPTITSANNATFLIGKPNSFTVTATGSPAPTLSRSGALPSGVTFTPATGLLTGTPAPGTSGTYPLIFTASNGNLPNANHNFTLTVMVAQSLFLAFVKR